MRNLKKIVLVGFMGAGKTTLGKALAEKLEVLFIDLDEIIEEYEGKPISLLIQDSEHYFRALETAYLTHVLAQKEHCVLALGGGTFCFEENQKSLLKDEITTVYLDRSEDFLEKQVSKIHASRPLLSNDIEKVWAGARKLLCSRKEQYQQAKIHWKSDGWEVEPLLEIILNGEKI